MINIDKKEHCCGCSACKDACPVHCIEMKYDEEGFRYPEIDKNKCINCGKCESVCPILQIKKEKNKKYENDLTLAYAAQNKNEEERINSSSGGIFAVLAKHVIKNNGCVIGAIMTDTLEVKHVLVDKEEELKNIYGSKYLQSSLDNIFVSIKEKLLKNTLVLFSGTPCQIMALRTFLKKNYENLILVDIICHGVPSKKVWDRYINWKNSKEGRKVKKVNFRNKKNGWKKFNMALEYEDSTDEYISHSDDLFFNAYLDNIILRPSCYSCLFKGFNRNSDITLGDCWGINSICPEMDDDKGTSLLLINSKKGLNFWKEVDNECNIKEVDRKIALKYNSAAIHPVPKHLNQKRFYKNLNKKEYDETVIDAMKLNVFQKLYLKIKNKLSRY